MPSQYGMAGTRACEGLAAEDHGDRGPADAGKDVDVGDREEVAEEAQGSAGLDLLGDAEPAAHPGQDAHHDRAEQ